MAQPLRNQHSSGRRGMSDDCIRGFRGRQKILIALADHESQIAKQALASAPRIHDVSDHFAVVERNVGPHRVKLEAFTFH